MVEPFWKGRLLATLSDAEWEALCDGCAKCCVHKLEDVATGERCYTDVACRLLDTHTCRCTQYAERQRWVPACVNLRDELEDSLSWLPPTCAYRLIAEGRDLPEWHPLLSGDPESVHQVGVSVRGRVIREDPSLDLESRTVDWL